MRWSASFLLYQFCILLLLSVIWPCFPAYTYLVCSMHVLHLFCLYLSAVQIRLCRSPSFTPSVVWVTSKVRQARKQMGSRLRYHHGLWLVVIGHVPVWLGWWDRVRRTESEGPAVWFWLHRGLTGAAGLLHSVPIIHVRTWLAILHGTALCVLHQLLLTVACQGYSNEEGMQSG